MTQYSTVTQANGMSADSAPWINIVLNKLWKKYSPLIKKCLVQSKVHPKIENALSTDTNMKKALFTIEDVEMGTKVCLYIILLLYYVTLYNF